jgi:DNA topoisomerase I
MKVRQLATATYFIDKFVFRAGYDEETDSVGCSLLRSEHIELKSPNIVKFDFLGKGSIRYKKTVEVDRQVYKNLQIFKKDKDKKDKLFNEINASNIFRYLVEFFYKFI